MGVFTDSNATVYVNARFQNDTFGNFCTGIDQAPGANNGCFMDFSGWVYECGRVDHRREYSNSEFRIRNSEFKIPK